MTTVASEFGSWNAIDLRGDRKGSWTIIDRAPKRPKSGNLAWLARCDCGREKVVTSNNWRGGRSSNRCAVCSERRYYNQLPDGESSFNTLYYGYVKRAERRNLSWCLDRDQFRALTKQPCTYCGSPPSQTRNNTRGTPGYRYTGIDRLDPLRGYSIDNVAPCCGACNRAKSDLSVDAWRNHVKRLAERIGTW